MSSAVADPRSIGLKDKLRRVMHNRSDQTEGQKDQYRQQLALEVAAIESRTHPDTRGLPALRTVTFSLTLATYWDLSARTRICALGLWLRRSRVRVPSVTLSFAGKLQLSGALAEYRGSSRTAVELSGSTFAIVVY